MTTFEESCLRVLLVGEHPFILKELAEQLVNFYCFVNIYLINNPSSDTEEMNNSPVIKFIRNTPKEINTYHYLIIFADENTINNKSKSDELLNIIKSNSSGKVMLVVPYLFKEEIIGQQQLFIDNLLSICPAAIVCRPDIIPGDNIENSIGLLKDFSNKMSFNTDMILPEVYAAKQNVFVKNLIPLIFSLKAYGHTLALITKPIPPQLFSEEQPATLSANPQPGKYRKLLSDEIILIPGLTASDLSVLKNQVLKINNVSSRSLQNPRVKPPEIDNTKNSQTKSLWNDGNRRQISDNSVAKSEKHLTNFPKHQSMSEGILKSFSSHFKISMKKALKILNIRSLRKPKIVNTLNFKGKKDPPKYKWIFLSFLLLLIILIVIPTGALLISFGLLNLGEFSLNKDYINIAQIFFSSAKTVSLKGQQYDLILTTFLPWNKVSQTVTSNEKFVEKYADIQKRSILVSESSSDLALKIFRGAEYNVEEESQKIALEQEDLYKELSFLSGEMSSKNNLEKILISQGITDSLQEKRKKALSLSILLQQMPVLLGKGIPRSYAFIIQDTSFARPSGGDINAVVIVRFSDGKIIDTQFFSTEEIDKLLKGQVDPPDPLKKYWGVGGWTLRNANWEADFPTTAQKIEWFIDKEVDISVDGVITIPAPMLENINLNGSTDKNSNTSLNILKDEKFNIDSLKKLTGEQIQNLLLSMDKDLEAKDLLVFLHDKEAKSALSLTNWDGSDNYPNCSDNCYSDYAGIIENSVYRKEDINEQAEYLISLEDGIIKHSLIIYFDNSKNEREYNSYLRVKTLGNAGYGKVELIGQGKRDTVTPDIFAGRGFKEAGAYLSVPAGEAKAISFSWESDSTLVYSVKGEYLMTLWKQPGVSNYPVKVTLNIPSLTQSGSHEYNTTLVKDKTIKVEW